MPAEKSLRLNYYVGSLLAQGGDVRVEGSKIIFLPTSALDIAMGAKPVEIPFQSIKGLEHKGEFLRTFNVKTDDGVHKFEGSQAIKLAELLEASLREEGMADNIPFERAQPAETLIKCPKCSKQVKSEFTFCPSCGTSINTTCKSCKKKVEEDWAMCAFCGNKLKEPPQS